MSYAVKVFIRDDPADQPSWFNNAWNNLYYEGLPDGKKWDSVDDMWNEVFDNVITLDITDYSRTITFPSEQDYVMFLLRWS